MRKKPQAPWDWECPYHDSCPYLEGISTQWTLTELEMVRSQNSDLWQEVFSWREENQSIKKELKRLQEENDWLKAQLKQVHRRWYGKGKEERDNENLEPEGEKTTPAGKRGAPLGHPGTTRPKPDHVDETIDVTLQQCPFCGGEELTECDKTEDHYQEDIIPARVKVTCYRHHYYYCPHCQNTFSGGVGEDELPGSFIGPYARSMSAFLRYGIGIPYRKVKVILEKIAGLKIDTSSLVNFDKQLKRKAQSFYQDLKEKVRWSDHVHADETGWPVNGKGQWLWCFTNPRLALYHIDPSRGSRVPLSFLGNQYNGILISDFYSAYGPVKARRKQKCLVHLLRDCKKLQEAFSKDEEVRVFVGQLISLIKKAIAGKRFPVKTFYKFWEKKRLENTRAEKLRLRVFKFKKELFTFRKHPDIDSNNNLVERQLRPNVILRKITYGSREPSGTSNHSIIMSLIQTAKLNGHHELEILQDVLTRDSDTVIRKIYSPPQPA